MNIAVEKSGDIAVVLLKFATLDASTSKNFKQEVAPVLEENQKVIFDLSEVTFVDSSGLGAFLSSLRTLNGKGGNLKLCGMSKNVRSIFELVRMHRVFDIYNTQEEAAQGF